MKCRYVQIVQIPSLLFDVYVSDLFISFEPAHLTHPSLTTSMLTCLFLNLRELALDPDCNVSSASQMSDLRFTRILGNIESTTAQGTA